MKTSLLSRRRPLRVLTMNIWGFTEPYSARMRLLRKGIIRLDPDLMAFQEAGFARGKNQVANVLDGLGYHVIHQFEHSSHGRRFQDGICVASRWPMKITELLSLQVTKRATKYPYAALAITVAAPEPAGPILFVNAKPSWELTAERERELQAVALARMVERRSRLDGFPPILAGDFDATPDSASIRFLTGKQSLTGMSVCYRDAWAEAGDGTEGHTWTYRNPCVRTCLDRWRVSRTHERRIDYIFLAWPRFFKRHARIRRCRVVLDRPERNVRPSDHYAVYAEIDVVT
jgi:endonuclease/exonuclease/phosphatase family metal-dependent hydrolase